MKKISVGDTVPLRSGYIGAVLTDNGERVSVQIEVTSDFPNSDREGIWEHGVIACELGPLVDLLDRLVEELERITSVPLKPITPSREDETHERD